MNQNRKPSSWQYHFCPECKEKTLHDAQDGMPATLICVDADLEQWAIRRFRICRHCWQRHQTEEVSRSRLTDQNFWNSAVVSEHLDLIAGHQFQAKKIKQLKQASVMEQPALFEELERGHEHLRRAMEDATALTDSTPVELTAIDGGNSVEQ